MRSHGKLLALGLMLWLALAGVARADTITPTRFDDPAGAGNCPSDCSLRQAIAATGAADTIALKSGGYQLSQGSSLAITRDVTITGQGRDSTLIEGFQNADAQGR